MSALSFSSNIRKRLSGNNILLVHDHGHTGLAMHSLGAVDPERLRILHFHRVDGDLAGGGAGADVHVAGEEAGRIGDVRLDGRAGIVKVRLHDAVVASEELELDQVARSSLDVVRGEGEAIRGRGDRHDVDLLCGSQAQKGSYNSTG